MNGLLPAQRMRTLWDCTAFNVLALALVALALVGCAAKGPRPMSIKMYHPEKKTTLDCKARDLGMADPNMLADSVETCARQLEKSGFVRQSSEPSGATRP